MLDYGYDSAGNRTSLTAIVGDETFETTYTFDALNRVETVTDPSGGVYSYSYDPNGNPETLTYPNGVVTTWTFDSQNRLDSLVTKDAAGEVLQSYDYTLALTGHRTAIEEHGGPRSGTRRDYAYDDLWRLTEDRVTGPDGSLEYQQKFQYDPVGNRLFDTLTDDIWKGRIAGYSYDERDRLVLRNGRPWEWDRGGRLLEEAGYEGWWIPGRSYEWDDDERLLSVEWTEHERLVGVDPGRLENVYDADGHRIESTEIQDGESTTTQYLVDESGWLSHVVAEIRDGEVVTHYQRAGDQLLGLVREGSTADRYFHLDGLGSVRGLTDASGTVTDRYEYTAYGERLEEGTDPQPYGFTGEPWSSVMELAHHRARWMDPAMGRFLSVDPWKGTQADPFSLHRYLYAESSPAHVLDPTGLSGFSLGEMALLAGVMGTISATIVGAVTYHRTGSKSDAALAAAKAFLVTAGVTASVYAVLWAGTAIFIYASTGGFTSSYWLFSTFQRGTAYSIVLQKPLRVFRWWGGQAQKTGRWWTPERYQGSRQAIEFLALRPSWGNTATNVSEGVIPAGTRLLIGRAASQGSLQGGGVQIFIENPSLVTFLF